METLREKTITRSFACKILRTTADALERGDIHSGFVLVNFSQEGLDRHQVIDACVSIDYRESWTGKSDHFELGTWEEEKAE